MCGITGISGDFEETFLKQSTKILSHRGPDDDGIFVDNENQIGLGHTRLSIIDLTDRAHQPMTSRDNNITIVFNGEIYNYEILRSELQDDNFVFQSESDTEVILNLYARDGIEFLKKLKGIFGLAIFDKSRKELFIARDGIGIKPLYYSENNNTFSFASEIKAILKLTDSKYNIDYNSINRYLNFLWCPGKGTPFLEVKKVLPGQVLTVRDGQVTCKKFFYNLPSIKFDNYISSRDEAINLVRKKLLSSVKNQLVSDVPVGAFLSGGLDSSAIVAMAKANGVYLPCFTIEPEGGLDDGVAEDLPYAEKVAEYLGVKLEKVKINSKDLSDDLEKMIWTLDEPIADPAPLNVLYISQLAREHGIKVLLSGSGGDDIFTGYRRHMAIKYDYFWSWMSSSSRKKIHYLTSLLNNEKPFSRKLNRLFSDAACDGDERLISFFHWASQDETFDLFSNNIKKTIAKSEASAPIKKYLSTLSPNHTQIEKMLSIEQKFFLADHNLIYTDKMSMACGIEVRVPLLDNDMIEIAAKIPDKFKQRWFQNKWIFKKAMEPFLPRDVIYRPKTGFGAPLRRWMKQDLRDMVSSLLSKKNIKERGIFDGTKVQTLINDNDSGKVDAAYIIFSLLCIEVWCRKFIDQK